LLHPASGNDVYAARIVGPEVVAAIARRARLGDITQQESATAIHQVRVELNARFQIIELTSALAEAAMNPAEGRALRGYDSVQLAAALELNVAFARTGSAITMVSADEELNTAARAEGLVVENPNLHPTP
jgi:predicted nucleic acid-binding protein